LDESKAPKWMDVEIKYTEVDISNINRQNLAKISDHWSKNNTIEIFDLLKEYQYVFSRDYKCLNGLVKEMGEIKMNLIL
jgi:hypothetical protein